MSVHVSSTSQIGLLLAERLGLTLPKQEGHDLAGQCIACQSSDAFRLHAQTGVAQCYSCHGKWSPFQLAEVVLKDRELAKKLLVEIGVFKASVNGHSLLPEQPADPIAEIARQKGVTPESLKAYGAKAISSTQVQLRAYGPAGKPCTTFSMSTKGGKGLFAKGKPAGLFFPHDAGVVRLPKAGDVWHLVEGAKDAAALFSLGLLACGLNTCRLAPKFARLFAGVDIVLVPDRDRAGEDGGRASASALRGAAKSVKIAAEFKDSDGVDVRDILRQRDGREQVLQAIADAQPWAPEKTAPKPVDDRPEIEVTPEEHIVNDQATLAIARDPGIFQRSGALVRIQHDHSGKILTGITRPANTPRIVAIREASLRERLTAVARFVKRKETDDGEEIIHMHPPAFCISAVAARGQWSSIRHLEGVISSPILRRDGTVLQVPGYDPAMGLFYEPTGEAIEVADAPTLEDSRAACRILLEVVSDFPFSTDAHRAAWLALVLTPLARHAFTGPSPLFLIDANVRASGKSLLADAASLIVTGREIARMSCAQDDDEMRKRITAIALAADQMVLIDNIAGQLGSASIDAALTGTVWKDRILGRSEIAEIPLITTWAATGNNVVLLADTSRRVCHIRLESKLENPESREGFRHADLLAWVRDQRPRLLSAALTILSAYVRGGSPGQGLKAWGSFEVWSALVRQALVWTGMPDPGETREELARTSDREAAALRSLIQGWTEVDPEGAGLTAAKLVECLEKAPGDFELLRNAVLELCPAPAGKLPGSRSLGNKLRHLQGRVVGGKAIDKRDTHGTAVWLVTEIGQGSEPAVTATGCSGGSGCSASGPSPAQFEQPCAGEDSRSHIVERERAQAEQPEPPEQPGGEPARR